MSMPEPHPDHVKECLRGLLKDIEEHCVMLPQEVRALAGVNIQVMNRARKACGMKILSPP